MKIAIIGGGFYGCNFAIEIKEKFKNLVDITIFDKEKSILTGAIANNQHRLHLGFHYPRCDATIEQSKRTYNSFLDQFGHCTVKCPNYYLVHNESQVSYDKYLDKFKTKEINYEEIDKKEISKFVEIKNIEGVVMCDERVINLTKLRGEIKKKLINSGVKVIVDKKINNIYELKEYDHVINCTYSSPEIGLENKIKTKSELCFIPILHDKNIYFKNNCFTIMDGPFSSLYQTSTEGYLSVSNVNKTPYYKSKDVDELLSIKENLSGTKIKEICYDIIEESSKCFPNLKQTKLANCYISVKTKIEKDDNDFRGSFLLSEEKNTSIMCGKISCFYDLKPTMLDIIQERLK